MNDIVFRPALGPSGLAVPADAPRPARARQRLRLGDMLVSQGVISGQQLQQALNEQKRSGRRLGRILIEDGITTEETIGKALAQQLKVPYLELTRDRVHTRTGRLLSETQARRFRALPIDEAGGVVRVGMADPTDYQSFDEVQRILGREVDLVVITEASLNRVLDLLHSKSEEISGLTRELEQEFSAESGLPVNVTVAQVDDAPVAKLLQSLFEDALRARASDIHLEPQERKLQVRFRIDGALSMHTEAESRIAPAVIQRVKLMAGLDIAERRLPQDGRCVVKVRNQMLDVRISTMPTQYGESVVLRLLAQKTGLLHLANLGMPAPIMDRLHAFMKSGRGMLLVTGPTGSGKTTTLYAALAGMNSVEAKIITVEDPVEYRLPGINQVQVNEKIGLGFATVLRSTLRQDPDIVLVGEMRDRETMETGLRAAMTGHMVLSTLHTNDAASTPLRLLDMGAARFLVASSLRLVLAQRLVRTVCRSCEEPYRPTPQEQAFLAAICGRPGGTPADTSGMKRGAGCGACNRTGYLGRHGVYELLDMSAAVTAALNGSDTEAYVAAARREIGTLSLAHHAGELVLSGRTTVSEAMRRVGRTFDPGAHAH
jgi:MSHA biogenesis protein MshE